jgi:L-seryl-tRNA(Ser) seleniumtransferase
VHSFKPTALNKPLSSSLLAPREGAAALPSVDRILGLAFVPGLTERYGHASINDAVRALLAEKRQAIVAGTAPQFAWPSGEQWIETELRKRLEAAAAPRLRRVFNLTGVVLHTNLGRAPMPEEAIEAVSQAMRSAVNLELDLESGGRGERDQLVEGWLRELTGAQAATVVNNNAAAVLLALNTLALKKEVIVSRGELIEIGGAFRMPDIMARGGVKLVEVGTTNRTHLHDYEEAVGRNTALIAKVHTSNYAIQGFTAQVAEAELAALARRHEVPLMVDLGSGSLVDLTQYGLPKEPTVRESIEAGADVVTFSADKLLGGPQAGVIVGREALVARIRKNPLKRALRVDKMTLAALEAVLLLYRNPQKLAQRLTTLRLLTRSQAEIEALGRRLLAPLQTALAGRAKVELRFCQSQIGSGSLPIELLPSAALVIAPATKGRGSGTALKMLAKQLRDLPVPVLGRVGEGALWLDLRCLENPDDFIAQLAHLERDASAGAGS